MNVTAFRWGCQYWVWKEHPPKNGWVVAHHFVTNSTRQLKAKSMFQSHQSCTFKMDLKYIRPAEMIQNKASQSETKTWKYSIMVGPLCFTFASKLNLFVKTVKCQYNWIPNKAALVHIFSVFCQTTKCDWKSAHYDCDHCSHKILLL